MGDTLAFPCDFDTAMELWTAWKDGYVMPRAGGLLDQPRWWRQLIRLITSRYVPVYDQQRRETAESDEPNAPKRNKRPAADDQWHEPGGLPVADGWDALNQS